MGSNLNTQLTYTNFASGQVGLYVDANTELSLQTNNGNQWLGTYSSWGAACAFDASSNSNNQSILNLEQFSVYTGLYEPPIASGYPQIGISDSLDSFSLEKQGASTSLTWFVLGLPPDSAPCTNINWTSFYKDAKVPTPTAQDSSIVFGMYYTGDYPAQTQWAAKRYLYRKLKANHSLVENYNLMQNYFDTIQLSNIKAFEKVKDSIQNLLPAGGNGLWVKQQRDSIKSLNSTISAIDSMITATNDSSTDGMSLQKLADARKKLLVEIQSFTNTLQEAKTSIAATVGIKANNALAANSAIQPSGIYESNEKTVNDIYLRRMASDTFRYTSNDISNLAYIAWQCPLEGGEAVYRARSMYRTVAMDTFFDDRVLCNRTYKMKKVDTVQTLKLQPQISIYPNPANDEVTIIFTNVTNPTLRLQIINDMGQVITNQVIATSGGMIKFDVSNIVEGIYYFGLYSSDKLMHEQTIVIIK